MIDALAMALAVGALATGVTAAALAGFGSFRQARFVPTLVLLELGLLVQAVLDLVALARGHHLREPVTHLAYLVTCLALVPVVAVQTRGDDGRWSALLLAVAMVVLAVLVVRLQTTWRDHV